MTTSSCDPELADELGLALERGQQARRAARGDDRRGVRLEGDDGVGAADDLAVAEVDAVEGADGDPARTGLDLGERRHLHPRNPTTGFSRPSSRGSAIATGPSASASRTCSAVGLAGDRLPVAGAPRGVGVDLDARQEAQRLLERQDALRIGVLAPSNGPMRVRRSSSQ